jgi:hypothetical protein
MNCSHTKDNGMTYVQHFKRAMSMSIALFIHAIIPCVLETYASDKMNEDKHD